MLTLAVFFNPMTASAQTFPAGRPTTVLSSKTATVGIDLAGGSIVDFRIAGSDLNPLTWGYAREGDLAPRQQGHFVCFDRWGPPSRQEQRNGMPFHGESTTSMWELLEAPTLRNGVVTSTVQCVLQMGGMTIKRSFELSERGPVFVVTDSITNDNNLGRVWNIVNHATIGPPFLDANVIVDTSAEKGFLQEQALPDPEARPIYWPDMAYNGTLVDFRYFTNNPNPSVVSFVFPDSTEYGWVTASNPDKGLLIGYIWDIAEYPWLNLWRAGRNGVLQARGLEFGTTGIHQPFSEILRIGKVFNTPIFEYLDSTASVEKSFVAFLAEIPADFGGVDDLVWHNGRIELVERAETPRRITISY
jgi:hypothetical protein